ncbi:hypothetical protein BVL87_12900, partial [Staphylococcus epidermidis]
QSSPAYRKRTIVPDDSELLGNCPETFRKPDLDLRQVFALATFQSSNLSSSPRPLDALAGVATISRRPYNIVARRTTGAVHCRPVSMRAKSVSIKLALVVVWSIFCQM